MAKVKTVFEKKGMELYRNGVHIATRKENEVAITDDGTKFEMIAVRMLNSKAFNKENGLTPIGAKIKAPKEVIPDAVIESIKPEPIEAPVIQAEVPRTRFIEPPSIIDRKNETIEETPVHPMLKYKKANPYGLEKKGIPDCPTGDERGTKDPAVMAWIETHFPDEYALIYEKFNNKKEFLAQREARQKALRENGEREWNKANKN